MLKDRPYRHRLLSNLFAILAGALIMWLFTTHRNAKKHETEQASTILQVAVDLSADGLRIDTTGVISGHQVELLELLLNGREYVLVPYSSRAEALDELSTGKVSLYATSFPYSASHEVENIVPTEWLYSSSFSLLYSDQHTDWASEFTGDKPVDVYVSTEDQAAILALQNLAELTYTAINIVESEETPIQLGVRMARNEIDFLVCDSAIANSIAEVDSTICVAHDISFDTHQSWLVNEQEVALKQALDSAIISHRGTKEWQQIISKRK